jgi:hypothetical protein
MSTSKKESVQNISKRIVSQKDAVSFIKKSKLQNKIFFNNEDVSEFIIIDNNDIKINLKTKSKKIQIRCENFNEFIIFNIDGESKILSIPSKNEAVENENYLHSTNELFIKCKNKDEDLFFKILSINKHFVKFEVLSDNDNFIYNNIGSEVSSIIGKDINSLDNNEIQINPSVEKVLENKMIVISRILSKKDETTVYLDDLLKPISEQSEKNHFIELLKMFEKETFGL